MRPCRSRTRSRTRSGVGVVRDAHGFVGIAYAYDRGDRTEGLLAECSHVGGDIPKDGGPEEVALPVHALAAGEHARSGPHRLVDLTLERVEEVATGERADLRLRFHRVADDEVLDALREAPLEFFGDGLDDDEPLGRDAGLAVVLITRADRGRRGQLEVR